MASLAAGAVSSVAGFGIGSILTPLLLTRFEARLAVAVVSVPHFLGSLLRFWLLRRQVDVGTLRRFGLFSAAGGLSGALLQGTLPNRALTLLLAGLLIGAGALAIAGVSRNLRFPPHMAWAAGAVSGLLGGLVGNQGGIRSAALLGFGLERQAFVATATATGLIVDAARMPVYYARHAQSLQAQWLVTAVSIAGVLVGTLAGADLLRRVPERVFSCVVGALLVALGLFLAARS
ncbi:MAG: sulfite exporter TauE/SafE family protein [Bryobacteraceae bacterium]|nr:sulfite exporter TauE/SafE family protein [Bryobacteraceae bacterium]